MEDGVHSGWEIDVRDPMPASLEGVDSQLPNRVFGCMLEPSSKSYVALRPTDAKAASLPVGVRRTCELLPVLWNLLLVRLSSLSG